MKSKPNPMDASSNQDPFKNEILEPLIRKVCEGDKAAVNELFANHMGVLEKTARLVLSRSNIKETFLSPAELVAETYQFYPFGVTQSVNDFNGFIYTMMQNRLTDLLRKGNTLKRGKDWEKTDLEKGGIEQASLQRSDNDLYANLVSDLVVALTGAEPERLGPILVAFRRKQRSESKNAGQTGSIQTGSIQTGSNVANPTLSNSNSRASGRSREKVLREKLRSMLDDHLAFQWINEKHGSVAEYFDVLLDQMLEDQLDQIDWEQDLDVIAMDLFLLMVSLIESSHNDPWRNDQPKERGPITFPKNLAELGALGKVDLLTRCGHLREHAPDQALVLGLKAMNHTLDEISHLTGLTFEQVRFRIAKGLAFLAAKDG